MSIQTNSVVVSIAEDDKQPLLSRNLNSARAAFSTGDAKASKRAHKAKSRDRGSQDHTPSEEPHNSAAGQYIKSAIFGGLDGIVTIFSCVASIEGGLGGSGVGAQILLILGFANLIADGISMGIGDALSTQAETQYASAERKRESWECDNYLEGEQREMVELYISKGLSAEDARTIVGILSKDKEIFVDFMMIEELGILPDEENASAWKNGLVTFVSFVLFGCVPLVAYVVTYVSLKNPSLTWIAFVVCCVFTGISLFILGAVKAKFTSQRWWVSGLQTLLLGGIAAGAAYGIGLGIQQLTKT